MLAFPSPRTGALCLALVMIATGGYFVPLLFTVALAGSGLFLILSLTELSMNLNLLPGKVLLTREMPGIVTVALPRHGKLLVANNSRLLVSYRIYEDSLPGVEKRYTSAWRKLAAGAQHTEPLAVTVHERGEQDLGGAGLRVVAGLGLWVLQLRYAGHAPLRVYPLIEELSRGDLFAHRRRLYGIGQHFSRKYGRGTEFDQLKDYTPDDEYRNINWKATARRGMPVVNQYRVEQSRDLLLLLDCGRLMNMEIAGRPRLDRYLDAAAQLAYIALSQKDRVGLIAFDTEVRAFVPPGRVARQMDNLIDAMFDLRPQFVESDYARAITELKARSPKRGMAVLFTDLLDSVSSRYAVANLARLARTHLPVVVILDDPAVERIASTPVRTVQDVYDRVAGEQFISDKQRTLTQLKAQGCLIINVAAERLNAAVVDEYLQIKARNLL